MRAIPILRFCAFPWFCCRNVLGYAIVVTFILTIANMLEYQIKRCTAPCVGKIKQDYQKDVIALKDFLSGKSSQALKTFDMEEAG